MSRIALKLSPVVLGATVFVLTVVNPIVTLMWATGGSISTTLSYFFPEDLNNLRNLIDLVSPVFALIIFVRFIRSPWWQRKINKESEQV